MGTTLLGVIGWAISCLVSLIVAIVVARAYLREKDKSLKYLAGYISIRFIFLLCIALVLPVYLWTKSLFVAGIILTIFWIAIFISLLFLPLLYCHFRDKGLKNWYFGATAAIVAAAIIILVTNFVPATYFPDTGVIFQPAPKVINTILYPFSKMVGLILLVFLFIGGALEIAGRERIRALLIGLGFLMIATTIIVPAYLPQLWNGLYCCIGDLLIFAGVMVRPGLKPK